MVTDTGIRAKDATANAVGSERPPVVLAGLVGQGIQRSRTPRLHEAEGAVQGLKLSYRLFDLDRMKPTAPSLAEILRAAEICGYAGLNITYPFKVDVLEHLDELSDDAATVGAANTVVFRHGRRSGHNTDKWGFTASFQRDMADAPHQSVLLIGAGGAGAAVAHALMDCGVEALWIADTDQHRADALAHRICAQYGAGTAHATTDIEGTADRVDGIVNATPVGMAKVPGNPVPEQCIRPPLWIADIIYFPLETELLRLARERGCRVLPGSGMAVFQAVRAFELFTGRQADSKRMEATFRAVDETAAASR